MSNVLRAEEVFGQAAALFARGEAPQAVTLLDQLAEQHPDDWALQRRVLSATGGCQIDAGHWRDAADRLERAKVFAEKLADPTAQLSVLVNQTSLYMATWQYRAVIEATDSVEIQADDGDLQRQEKSAALINRAHAALVLGELDTAEQAVNTAYLTLQSAHASEQRVNLLHLAAAGYCRVRVMLARNDLTAARALISELERLQLTDRAVVHLMLAHAALLAATGKHELARNLLRRLLDSKIPDGLRRDAMFGLLGVAQQVGDIRQALDLLTQLSDLVVSHRTAVLKDALNIREFAESTLSAAASAAPVADQQPKRLAPIETVFGSMARIVEASESAAAFQHRQRAAAIAALFALYSQHGIRFACAIARGLIMRDCGSLSLDSIAQHSSAFAHAALRSTLGVFDRLGLDRTLPEYRIAAFRYEHADGTGLLGVSARDTPAEAQIASLGWRAAHESPASLTHCASESLARTFEQWMNSIGAARLDDWLDRLDVAHFRDNSVPLDIVAAVTAQ